MLHAAGTPPRMTTLILLSGLSVMSLNLFLPSLANIAEEFDADYALVNLSIAGYAGVTAALQLVMGPLSDRYGRRIIILAGLLLFTLASIGCLLAKDIETFLSFRMMQGAIIAGYTVSLAVIRDTTDSTKAASAIGYLAMAWAIAPMLAPVFGGLLDDAFGWRSNFWAFILLGSGIFLLAWYDLGETNRTPSTTLAAQFRAYPALLRSRDFWGYGLCMGFSTGAFYAFLGGAPLVASEVFGISTGTLGLYMGSITAGFIFGSFLSGRYAARFTLKTMMIAGRLVACLGLAIGLAFVSSGTVTVVTVFGACIFVGVGNGITMPSANAGAMSVAPELSGSAAGLAGALTIGGGAVISAVSGAVVGAYTTPAILLSAMLTSSALGLVATFGIGGRNHAARHMQS